MAKEEDDDLKGVSIPLKEAYIQAKIEAAKAEAESFRAEAEEFKANARDTEMSILEKKETLERDKIETKKAQRLYAEEQASNKYFHIYNFMDEVSEKSVVACMNALTVWDRLDDKCDIEIIFSSPGGSVVDGMVLFDFIKQLRRRGHKVTTGALGYAASMAGILLQAGEHRWVGKESYILIHQVSFGAHGKFGEVEDEVKWVKKMQERILDIFAERCTYAGKHGTAKKPFTREQLAANWDRKDWWLDSDEALAGGVVDEIR